MIQLRACGIAVHNGKVLLQRKTQESIWALPGGKLHDGEQAAAALVREFTEELGGRLVIVRTVWVVENNFVHGDRLNHQVEFYFEVTLEHQAITGIDPSLIFQWASPDELGDLDFRPTVLRDQLFSLPTGTVHLVIH